MKKIIFIMLICASFNAFGQIKIGPKLNIGASWYGIKEKYNKLTEDRWTDGSTGLSFQGGVAAEIRLSNVFAIQPEILYSHYSSGYVNSFDFDEKGNHTGVYYYDFYSKININQIQFPLQIKAQSKRLYFMTGVCYGIGFKNKNSYHIEKSNYIIKKRFDRDDMAIINSLGVFINKNISIDLKLYTGLINIDSYGYKIRSLSIGSTVLF